jgi:hypothetical protein
MNDDTINIYWNHIKILYINLSYPCFLWLKFHLFIMITIYRLPILLSDNYHLEFLIIILL